MSTSLNPLRGLSLGSEVVSLRCSQSFDTITKLRADVQICFGYSCTRRNGIEVGWLVLVLSEEFANHLLNLLLPVLGPLLRVSGLAADVPLPRFPIHPFGSCKGIAVF